MPYLYLRPSRALALFIFPFSAVSSGWSSLLAISAEVLTYTDPILESVPEIKPVGIGTFADALDYNNLSWIYKKILKSQEAPEGDFRDWGAIRAWARDPLLAKFTR